MANGLGWFMVASSFAVLAVMSELIRRNNERHK